MKYIFIIILFFLYSCSNNKNNEPKENNDQLHSQLANKYDADGNDSDLDGYVYQLQDRFITQKKLLCVMAHIQDIVKYDSFYMLNVQKRMYEDDDRYYLIRLKVNKSLVQKLISSQQPKSTRRGSFVFNVTAIDMGGGTQKFANDDENSNTYYSEVSSIIFNGELIDFILYPQPE